MEMLLIIVAGLAAIAAVAYPALRRARRAEDRAGIPDSAIEAEVARYRAALRANTICPACLEANPPESRYCADCGRSLHAEPDVEDP